MTPARWFAVYAPNLGSLASDSAHQAAWIGYDPEASWGIYANEFFLVFFSDAKLIFESSAELPTNNHLNTAEKEPSFPHEGSTSPNAHAGVRFKRSRICH